MGWLTRTRASVIDYVSYTLPGQTLGELQTRRKACIYGFSAARIQRGSDLRRRRSPPFNYLRTAELRPWGPATRSAPARNR
jgi:hypothetical protein